MKAIMIKGKKKTSKQINNENALSKKFGKLKHYAVYFFVSSFISFSPASDFPGSTNLLIKFYAAVNSDYSFRSIWLLNHLQKKNSFLFKKKKNNKR